jgi:hypothetical protein
VVLEIRRDLYLDEAAWLPHDGESRIVGLVTDVVEAVAQRTTDG